jgi:NAD(P)-dependent dehydrogenase (short-subunit alcohol dehydrogenase family)
MFFMVQAALPHLKEGAAIINCTSITMYKGSAMLLDYSSTKGAITAFTRSLSQSLIKQKIRVNAVAPGPIWTSLNPSGGQPPEKIPEFGLPVPRLRGQQLHGGASAAPQWRDRGQRLIGNLSQLLAVKNPNSKHRSLISHGKIQLARSLQYKVEPHAGADQREISNVHHHRPPPHRRQPCRRIPHRLAVRQRRRRPASDRLTRSHRRTTE